VFFVGFSIFSANHGVNNCTSGSLAYLAAAAQPHRITGLLIAENQQKDIKNCKEKLPPEKVVPYCWSTLLNENITEFVILLGV